MRWAMSATAMAAPMMAMDHNKLRQLCMKNSIISHLLDLDAQM
jgi:hypothetical protein